MLLDKISENISSFRQNVILGIFLFLILVPSFFSGEWSKWLQAVIFITVFLLIIYTVFLNPAKRISWRLASIFSNANFYLIVFLAIALITCFFSVNTYKSFSLLFLLFSYAAIYFASYFYFRRWRRVLIITNSIFIVGVIVSIITLVMYVSQTSDRAAGFLFNANALSSYLLFSLPLGAALFLGRSKDKYTILYAAGLIIIGLAFFLSFSYTGWVAFIIPLLILIGYFRKKIFTKRSVLVIIIIAIIVLFILTVLFRYQQSNDISEALLVYQTIPFDHFISSFSQRLYFNQSSLEIFLDNSWLGTGLDTFQLVYSRYAHSVIEQPRYAHNYFLQTAAELGIFGLLSLLAFIVFFLRGIYRNIKKELDENRKRYLLGLGLGALGSIIHAVFDFGWQFPAVFILFWLISGIVMAQSRIQSASSSDEANIVANRKKMLPQICKLISIVLALLILIRGFTLFLGAYYFDKAERAADEAEITALTDYYHNGLLFDPDPLKVVNYAQSRIKFNWSLQPEDYLELEDKLKQVIKNNQGNYFAHWVLGRVYFVQDKFSQAEQAYQQALDYNPVFRPDFYYDLAFLYYDQQQYDQAKDTIFAILNKYPEGIRTSNPNLPTQLAFLNLLLGQIYKDQDNLIMAAKFYNKSLLIKPGFNLAIDQLEELSE